MATITYEVTVATGTNWYSANANKYYINGEVAPLLYLQEGNTYVSSIKIMLLIQVIL
jgi:hypothetical protein